MAIEFDPPLEHEASGDEIGYLRITRINIDNEDETVRVIAKTWRTKKRRQDNKRHQTHEFRFAGTDYDAIVMNGTQRIHKSVEDLIMELPAWRGGRQTAGV